MSTQTFDTARPIRLDARLGGGTLRVNAAATDVTLVAIAPANPDSPDDVGAAEQTRVELAGERLSVVGPRRRGLRSWFGGHGAVAVTIDLPQGSHVLVAGWSDVVCDGRLGDVEVDALMGDITVEHAASLRAKTAMGDIAASEVDGVLDARTSAGSVRVGSIAGAATLKTSAGDLAVREARDELRLDTAYGDIGVGTAGAGVVAKTSAGEIRVDCAVEGVVRLASSYGSIDVGVPHGTAAYLEIDSRTGSVRTDLADADAPQETERTVEIDARTQYGDVQIRRATTPTPKEDA